MKLELIIPTVPVDLETCLYNKKYFFKYLPITGIKFIGNDEVGRIVNSIDDPLLTYMDENVICRYEQFKNIVCKKIKNDGGILGWYYQQFLKIMYASKCEDEYYLVWDSDTIPIHEIKLFNDDGKPYFDLKTEFHEEYFETIDKAWNLSKCIDQSFISEHMLFKKTYVIEMMDYIKCKDKLEGNDFLDKIVNVIAEVGYDKLAFSEYETYGTYVMSYHRDEYELRMWKSMRRATWCLDKKNINDSQMKWLVCYYDAITFEKRDTCKKMMKWLVNQYLFRLLIKADVFDKYYEKIARRIYKSR